MLPVVIALNNGLEKFTIFLPYGFLLACECNILLNCVGELERSLDLGSPVEQTVLLNLYEIVQDFLELLGVAVGVESKTRKSLYGLAKQTCIKP